MRVPRVTVIEFVAFLFAMFTIYGQRQPVLYGLVLLLLGILYVWQRRRTGAYPMISPGRPAIICRCCPVGRPIRGRCKASICEMPAAQSCRSPRSVPARYSSCCF